MSAAHPNEVKLWLRPAPDWLEQQILAGADPERIQQRVITLDALSATYRERAEKIFDDLALDRGKEIVQVHGTGIDPGVRIKVDGEPFSPHAWITRQIGKVPIVNDPDNPESVIDGYRAWMARYIGYARDLFESPATRVPASAWLETRGSTIVYQHAGTSIEWILTGEESGADISRLLAADQRYAHAERLLGEDGIPEAFEICGTAPVVGHTRIDLDDVLSAETAWSWRLLRLARAITANRRNRRSRFEREKRRWIADQGSERLQIGIEDGYEMTPAYLQERIDLEFPGFLALPWDPKSKRFWKGRTSPSDMALKLRRKVQERLAEHTASDFTEPRADIGFMSGFDDAFFCNPDAEAPWEPRQVKPGYELIVVPAWLDRYVLAAVVPEDDLDHRIFESRVLDPADYGLGPSRKFTPTSDIPLDLSDFATAPPASSPPSEDDIPF